MSETYYIPFRWQVRFKGAFLAWEKDDYDNQQIEDVVKEYREARKHFIHPFPRQEKVMTFDQQAELYHLVSDEEGNLTGMLKIEDFGKKVFLGHKKPDPEKLRQMGNTNSVVSAIADDIESSVDATGIGIPVTKVHLDESYEITHSLSDMPKPEKLHQIQLLDIPLHESLILLRDFIKKKARWKMKAIVDKDMAKVMASFCLMMIAASFILSIIGMFILFHIWFLEQVFKFLWS